MRTQWRLVAVALVVALVACTLITSLAVLVTATEAGAVRGALRSTDPSETTVNISLTEPTLSIAEARVAIGAAVDSVLGSAAGARPLLTANSAPLDLPRTGKLFALAFLGEFDAIADHARLTAGHWPSATADPASSTIAVAIPLPAAQSMKLSVGDNITVLESPGHSLTLAVVGIFENPTPGSAYWNPDPLSGAGYDPHYPVPYSAGTLYTDAIGPLVMADGAFDARAIPVAKLVQRQEAQLSSTGIDQLVPLINDLRTADIEIPVHLGDVAGKVTYSSQLTTVLTSVASTLTVTRSTVAVVALMLLVLAVAALAQTARLLADARLGERHLMRARGSSARQLLGVAAIESLGIAAVTTALSAVLARLVYIGLSRQPAMVAAGMTRDPGISPASWMIAAAVSLVFFVVLIAPLLRDSGTFHEAEQGRSRQRRASVVQRYGIDIAVAVLAGIAFWQLTTYKSAAGNSATLSIDPVLVAGPALVLLAGALLCARLIPLASLLAERIAKIARGAVTPLAAWEVGRRSQRTIAAVLLLTLALSVGTFSLTFLATWRQSQVDQADFAVGAPFRVSTTDPVSAAVTPALPDGVTLTPHPVYRSAQQLAGPNSYVFAGGAADGVGTEVLGLSQTAAGMLDSGRLARVGGSQIAAMIGDTPRAEYAVALGTNVYGLSAVVQVEPAGELKGASASVRAILENPSGVLTTLELGVVPVDGGEHGVRGILPIENSPAEPSLAMRLMGLQTVVFIADDSDAPPSNARNTATMRLKDLAVLGKPITVPDPAGGTTAVTTYPSSSVQVDPKTTWFVPGDSSGSSGRMSVTHPAGWQLGMVFGIYEGLRSSPVVALEMGWSTVLVVPAVISAELASKFGAYPGSALTLVVDGTAVPVVVDSVMTDIPAGGSKTSFSVLNLGSHDGDTGGTTVVVDQWLLARALYQAGADEPVVTEWWLDVPNGAGAALTKTFAASTSDLSTSSADVLGQQMQEHPLRVATQGALWLVIVGAALLAALGFAIHATGSLRSRTIEFAQLRAIGLSRARLVGVVTTESLLLCVFGTLFGVGIGLLLGWLVTPLVGASVDGSLPVPPVETTVPWGQIALLSAEIAAVLACVILVVARMQRSADPAGALRRGDER